MAIAAKTQTLSIPSLVCEGYGEYVAFKQADLAVKELSYEEYQKIYDIFLEFKTSDSLTGEYSAKEFLLKKIHAIDPEIHIAFIPNILYSLIYIHRCIDEDLSNEKICSLSEIQVSKINDTALQTLKSSRNCWHMYFRKKRQRDSSYKITCPNELKQIADIAYNLNNFIFKNFNPKKDGFTFVQLKNFLNEELEFFKKFYFEDDLRKKIKIYSDYEGPTLSFSKFCFTSLGIKDEKDRKILMNALCIECSSLAKNAILLYRGSIKDLDSPNKAGPNSLSFSTSIFAGAVYDPSGTSFHYMRKEKKDAFVLIVSKKDKDIFFIPSQGIIAQINGFGEFFHARTKIWKKEKKHSHVGGISLSYNHDELKEIEINLECDLSKSEICEQFEKHKQGAIDLKKDFDIA